MKSVPLIAFLCTLSIAKFVLAGWDAVNVPSKYADMIDEDGWLSSLPITMYFPSDNGEPQQGKVLGSAPWVPEVKETDVFYMLYTRGNPTKGTRLITGDERSVKNSKFNASEPTFIVTHGFIQGIESITIQTMKDMYIANRKGNVIAVDWSKMSKTPFYYIAKAQTEKVGKHVAAFVAFLVKVTGMDVSSVHLCGHSLGAHVCGIAGENIFKSVGKKPGRITGLDPAGPLYSLSARERRLDKGDADFVDIIHTCGGWLGMYPPCGHVDFYPNGGTMRHPGCNDYVIMGVCSHDRSWQYLAESMGSDQFSSTPCSSYKDYLDNKCDQNLTVPMGMDTPKSTRGIYYLKTEESPPYALG